MSQMLDYVEIAFEARGYPTDWSYIPMCELWCGKKAVDIDHILWRGWKHNTDNRMYDPFNLIMICRECHQNKGGFERKENAKQIARKNILSKKKE